ncbi:MAG: Fe-S-binding domain-containing protein, partial [Sphingobacteriaceae bacterium]
ANTSVISSNHYDSLKPLPVVKKNLALQEANKEQLERYTRL